MRINSKTFNVSASKIEIVVGTNNWLKNGIRYKVSDIIAHDGYRSSDSANDIALIRVETPIKFNQKVKAIKFTAKEVAPGTKLQTTGWGSLKVI